MFRRKTRDERRENTSGIILFIAATFLVFLAACSDSTSTAGVISETESGQTASTDTLSGHIYNNFDYSIEAKKYPHAIVALTKVVNGRTIIVDSTTSDDNGDFTFVAAPTDAYSVVATFERHDTTWAGMTRLTPENKYNSIAIGPAGTILLSPRYNGLSVGDTLCITGTLSCAAITEENKDEEYITITGIPANHDGYTYTTITQIEIANESGVKSIPVEWDLYSDGTLVVKDSVLAKVIGEEVISLPKISEMDSLDDKTLDSLIVPVFFNTDRTVSYTHDDGFMGPDGSLLPWANAYEHSIDTSSTWVLDNIKSVFFVTVPSISKSITIKKLYGAPGSIDIYPEDRIRFVRNFNGSDSLNVRASTIRDRFKELNVFSDDSSFAIGFWITLNGNDLTADNSVLASSLSSNGKLGFEIRQCESDKKSLCTKIYNGIDSASTAETEFGKAKILDGKQHYYSLVIHKKHLDISVDGKSIRSTDLKLSNKFYGLNGFELGNHDLDQLIIYSFGNFIRKENEKNWMRLKAWQRAFYELQKKAKETTFEHYQKF
ncbi:carboxypeptidase-like regulatory domain-containing protein [uncultured Fibrobacter sp.]|uniref:carboxypeptidase-like regulatory domain-containing protein n=1 Tax=uncultured Fibrobacter sp. TaxID=261512 RepID=UPI0026247790|nr:carboxypeptidase-like regulatory domain-containing protein [uncultured Fibrobacter sp.]